MLKIKFSPFRETILDDECLILLFSSKNKLNNTIDERIKAKIKDATAAIEKLEDASVTTVHTGIGKKIIYVNCFGINSSFEALGLARKIVKAADNSKKAVWSVLTTLDEEIARHMVDALVSAAKVADWEFPKYTSKKNRNPKKNITLHFIELDKKLKKTADKALISAESNSIVRELSMRAANDLNPKTYVSYLRNEAKKYGLKIEVTTQKKLKAMGAGCFTAVAQGSAHEDAAVVKISYKPTKKTSKSLCLVGKGITYDTGGTCLKPAQYMLGMNGDMGGSAVAFATLIALCKLNVNFNVNCFLAIADNDIGSRAFRPNEIVTALNGTTVETIHTDAEGRMVLADTLCMASKEKYALMINYATLTGACVKAVGTTYSGVFSHNHDLAMDAMQAGKDSGERVWPFPMDEDFGDCLKSDIADTKQCRPTGGVDHIEAAYFLSSFVSDKKNWLHVDLSSIENPGGLGHVQTENTGFGVRFSLALIENRGFKL